MVTSWTSPPTSTSLRADLEAAAAAGTEDTQATARLLSGALDASLRLCLVDALSAMAAEVTAASDVEVEIRMHGREPQVVVTVRTSRAGRRAHRAPTTTAAPPASPSACPSRSRSGPRTQAARDGLSVNAWMVRAVHGAHAARQRGTATAAARAAPPASPAADHQPSARPQEHTMPTKTHRFPTPEPIRLHLRSGRGTVQIVAERRHRDRRRGERPARRPAGARRGIERRAHDHRRRAPSPQARQRPPARHHRAPARGLLPRPRHGVGQHRRQRTGRPRRGAGGQRRGVHRAGRRRRRRPLGERRHAPRHGRRHRAAQERLRRPARLAASAARAPPPPRPAPSTWAGPARPSAPSRRRAPSPSATPSAARSTSAPPRATWPWASARARSCGSTSPRCRVAPRSDLAPEAARLRRERGDADGPRRTVSGDITVAPSGSAGAGFDDRRQTA